MYIRPSEYVFKYKSLHFIKYLIYIAYFTLTSYLSLQTVFTYNTQKNIYI